nr:hypothetical protein [Tanacetum cinerariifolium]
MLNFISSSDLLCWNIVLKGNSAKSMKTDNDGNMKIRPPVTTEEHQQGYLECHQGKIYGNAESNKMQKSLLKQKFEEFKISEEEGLDKGGLEYISFDDLYNKLKFLEIDTKGYSLSSSTLSNAAFRNEVGFFFGNCEEWFKIRSVDSSFQDLSTGSDTTCWISVIDLSSLFPGWIATTAIVPFREPIPIESNTDKPVVTLVYLRKSKAAKKKVPVSNPKINKSLVTYKTEPQNSRGSTSSNVPSSLIECMLSKLFSEAVATACFTQNRSTIRLHHGKTPYELMQNKLPDLSFLHVFGAICYLTNDSENLGKLQTKADIRIFIGYAPTKKAFWIYNMRTRRIIETIHVDFDELTAMASEQSSSGPALNDMTPATISLGLVQKYYSSTPYVPPSRNDWDLLFQPMFDELLNPPPSVDHQAAEFIAPIADVIPPVQADLIGLPSLTTVDQDAPSLSKSHTTTKTQSSVIPQDVEEDNLDIKVTHIGNDPLFGVHIPEVTSAQSSSTVSPHLIVQPDHQIPQYISKWTKDHPLQNIIGQLSRPVSTRLQLHEQALFCYYNAFLTSVEPKTYKEALTQSCWIEAMQEELNKFK